MWSRWTTQQFEKLRPGIVISMDVSSCASEKSQGEEASPDAPAIGIHALDLGYSGLKSQIEKCQEIFDGSRAIECSICRRETPSVGFATLVCPHEGCKAGFHLQCLSTAFLKAEGGTAKDALIPTTGNCPQCDASLMWADLVKDLSVRMRGEKEIKVICKPRRANKAAAAAENDHDSGSENEMLDNALLEQGDWHELSDSTDNEHIAMNAQSDPALSAPSFKRSTIAEKRSVPIIQDSESDEGDILY